MLSGIFIAALLGAGALEIELAPDQPMPHVYTGEPLVVEVRAERDTRARATLTVQGAHDAQAWQSPEAEFTLRANSPHWQVYEGLPEARGFYAALFRVQYGEHTEELRGHFSRIDRPFTGIPQAFSIALHSNTENTLRLMRHVGVPAARIRLDSPHLETALALAGEYGIKLYVQVADGEMDALAAQLEKLAKAHCQNIARLEIATYGEQGRLARLLDAARAANCAVPVYAVLHNVGEVRQLMQNGGHALVRGIVAEGGALDYAALLQWRAEIQEGGYESLPLETANTLETVNAAGRMEPGHIFAGFMQQAGGASQVGFDGRLLYQETPGELLAYFNGLAQQLPGLQPFGVMVLSASVSVPVFRSGSDWCIVLWSPAGNERVQLPLGDATGLRHTDAFNNPLPEPELADGLLAVTAGSRVTLLWGNGGEIFGRMARAQAGHIARRFAENEAFGDYLSPDLMETVAAISRDPGGREGRTQYFQLLRSFPELEAQWHAGVLPRPVAVPAIANLATLARHLCTLEQERGESILEPMSDMLARAREYQSLYLTGTVDAKQPYNRGDWLLKEVKRLTDEAHTLADAGVRIEASAVAALAEWRARALEFAAKAGPQSTLSAIGPVTKAQ